MSEIDSTLSFFDNYSIPPTTKNMAGTNILNVWTAKNNIPRTDFQVTPESALVEMRSNLKVEDERILRKGGSMVLHPTYIAPTQIATSAPDSLIDLIKLATGNLVYNDVKMTTFFRM